ncbi:hypothetical protein [Micromonospora globbae]|uniref:Uncharacterized protein n=1 Tax=Micromonospora globbae TaxID=1894969 RepID=A0A420EWW6_9ACTN|nr:hypothetical protein [Micromonospora globbae]RKF25245.1 hypothetical protein D7I43_22595 [Micromonospora globbae]
MTTTAAYALAAVLLGGPAVMLAPFVVARRLVDRHADEVGPVIRAAGRDDLDPAAFRAIAKETAR